MSLINKIVKATSTLLFFCATIPFGIFMFGRLKFYFGFYLYPNIEKDFWIFVIPVLVVVLLFIISYVVVFSSKPTWTIFLKEISFIIFAVAFCVVAFLTMFGLDFFINSHTENFDNYLVTDFKETADVEKCFPEKTVVENYKKLGAGCEYSYTYEEYEFTNCYNISLKITFGENDALFNEFVKTEVSKFDCETIESGNTVTHYVRYEQVDLHYADGGNALFIEKIIVNNSEYSVEYHSSKERIYY